MNGLQAVLWHYRRPYGIVRKNNHVSGPFFNFSRRHCLEIESLAPPVAWRKSDGNNSIPQKDESPSEGPKNGIQGQKTACASAGDDGRQRRINSIDGRFRPKIGEKSACGSVCAFGFRGQGASQCLRAVGLRPDSGQGRMQSYAPYAVPLKGKRPKRLQLPKEVHKVHTASLMFAQPYSSLAFRFRRKSAYGVHTAVYEVHTDRIMRRKCEDVSWSRRGGYFQSSFFLPVSMSFRPVSARN